MLRRIITVLCMIALMFGIIPVQAASPAKPKLRYDITFENLSDGIVKGKLTISNLSGTSFQIMESEGLAQGFVSNIEISKIYNDKGQTLKYTKVATGTDSFAGSRKKWSIQLQNSKTIIVEYQRKGNLVKKYNNEDVNGTVYGYIGDGYTVIAGYHIFLIPPSNNIDPNIEVKLNTPTNAKIIVPWEKIGDIYYPNKNVSNPSVASTSYKEDIQLGYYFNTTTLTSPAIGIGQYDVYERDIAGIHVTVAMAPTAPKDKAEIYLKDLSTMLSYYKQLFGYIPHNKLNLILHSGINSKGNTIRCIEAADAIDSVYTYSMMHPVYHWWNFFEYGAKQQISELGWMVADGFNEYYLSKAAITNYTKLAFSGKEYYASNLKTDYEKYKALSKASPFVYRIAGNMNDTNNANAMFIAYQVGALYGLYLDYSIYELTGGQKSLDDVLRNLYLKHAYYKGYLGKDELLAELKAVTGKSFDSFYTDYIAGKKFLNMDKLFQDNDGDGIANYIEMMQKTNINDAKSYDAAYKEAIRTIVNGNDRYVGDVENGMPNGKGKLTRENGETYEGEFKDWQYNGYGTLTSKYGQVFVGTWKNGRPLNVKITFDSNNIMECQWSDWWKPTGIVIRETEWCTYEGTWSEDMAKYDSPVKGKMTYKQGGYYEGEFKDWKKHGIGKMVYADGTIQDGKWENDVFIGK